MNLRSLFGSKKVSGNDLPVATNTNLVAAVSNWYSDRYGKVLIQRNILFIFLIISACIVVFSVFQVSVISARYTIKPFVIEVEKRSGLTNIVNPMDDRNLTSNEALNQYFVMKYIRSRETYCSTDFRYNYLKVVRLLSVSSVFSDFRNFINHDPNSPILLYGKNICTGAKLRSIQFFSEKIPDSDQYKKTAMIRFTIYDVSGPRQIKLHKIASLEYKYVQMEMSIEERDINPLGFQVVNYRVDDEILTND